MEEVVEPAKTNKVNKKISDLLKVIQHRNQSYDDWRDACFALKNYYDSDETFALFCEWSEVGYQGYTRDACAKLWDSTKDDSEKPITLGTLRKWAKEDNPEEYKAWRDKYEFTSELRANPRF